MGPSISESLLVDLDLLPSFSSDFELVGEFWMISDYHHEDPSRQGRFVSRHFGLCLDILGPSGCTKILQNFLSRHFLLCLDILGFCLDISFSRLDILDMSFFLRPAKREQSQQE